MADLCSLRLHNSNLFRRDLAWGSEVRYRCDMGTWLVWEGSFGMRGADEAGPPSR